MRDFNDFQFFAAVVVHRGFSTAARALGLPKSRVSRRVALMGSIIKRLGLYDWGIENPIVIADIRSGSPNVLKIPCFAELGERVPMFWPVQRQCLGNSA